MMPKQTNEKMGSFMQRIELGPIVTVFAVIAVLCVYLLINPDAPATLSAFKTSMVHVLCSFYLWLGLGVVGFLGFFVFSKYGSIKLGGGKPEYSTFSWLVMMFCAGMGSSLLYWSCIEWMYYYSGPPMGAKPFSQLAAELSAAYPLFHWTITAWGLFTVGSVALAYRYYIKKKPGLTLTYCCERTLGEKLANGPLGKVVDVIFIFGIFGGLACTLAFGVPMLCDNLSKLTGIQNGFGLKVAMIAFVSLIFFISSYIGLEKGLKNLCDWNAYIAIALAVFVLIVGPTLFLISSTTNGIGYMIQHFVYMSLWTDPIANGGFPEAWTSFYWAWWLALGPWMWIFEVKVSKGRTIREMILGILGAGSIGAILYFGIIGNYGLYMQINNITDFVAVLNNQGATAAITSMIHSLPMGTLVLAVFMIVGTMFLATTLDSASWTLAAATTKNLGQDEEPARGFRMFWSIMLALVPMAFIFAKADLNALQTCAILTAVPIAIMTILSMTSAVQYVKEDYGEKTINEIVADNRQRDLEAQAEVEAVAANVDKTVA
jgi:BCCT family betaine/carnitine transporter